MKHLKHDKRGLSNVIVVMLSLVLIVIIVTNIILWNYQMNQLDWEKMQEKIILANIEHVTRSPWFTSQEEYTISAGSHVNGTYGDTQIVDGNYETFREENMPISYNPSGYNLIGSTKLVSGATANLVTNDEAYMTFRSYSSAFSPQTLYAHMETETISGTSYYQLRLGSVDSTGLTLQADTSTTGRKLLAKFVYSLTAITSIPESTWTLYYRAYKTGLNPIVHCDVDVLIRKTDGTIRTTVASNVANSPNLNRNSWSTVSATFFWSNYTVIEDSDFLEIDYYAHVTASQSGRRAYLRIDDSGLPAADRTRIMGMMLPSEHTVEVELIGTSNTQAWQSLTWTLHNAFTIASVNTTLRLYDHNTSQYPTNGSGYITYISSATPNTHEQQNQTFATNPTHFRNLTGDWKTKIKGAKNTASPFNLEADWAELKTTSQESYQLNMNEGSVLNTLTYPLTYTTSVEIQIRYRTIGSLKQWFLKAFNWTKGEYSNTGFNSTSGDLAAPEFKYYTVNLGDSWRYYVQDNGTIRVNFCDEGSDANQTTVDIDFLGVRAIIEGTKFSLRNEGSVTCHITAIWIVNSTIHKRYAANFFNSGISIDYFRADVQPPQNNTIVKVVTERGNTAILRKD